MHKHAKGVALAAAAATIFSATTLLSPLAVAADDAKTIEFGKKSAFDRKRGNCLACHMVGDGVSPGDIGPPLVAMKARFPDPAKLRAQIYDPMVANPDTRMPPYGKYKIITEQELDAIIAYLYTL
jgi:sulfur-oxidizing protein SoxX